LGGAIYAENSVLLLHGKNIVFETNIAQEDVSTVFYIY
jgi:hypothetical protein